MRRRRRLKSISAILLLLGAALVGTAAMSPATAGAEIASRGWLNIPNGDALAGSTGGLFQQFEGITVSGTGGATGTHTVNLVGGGRSFTITIAARTGAAPNTLAVGAYEGTTKTGGANEHRLDLAGNGTACSATFGRFVIDDIEFSGGSISRLALEIVQRCNSNDLTQPAATGLVWYQEPSGPLNSSLPTTEFVPLAAPQRVLDTRNGIGIGRTVAVGDHETVADIPVTGCAGCPPTGQTSAVVMNVTATRGSVASFLTVWPAGTAQPVVSNVNFRPFEDRPNLTVVKVSGDGKVNLYNELGAADVIFDVIGYFAPEASVTGGRYHAITPQRILDTRESGTPLRDGVPRPLAIPAAGATAAVLNVTVAGSSGGGFVTVYPGDQPSPPLASNLNFAPGQLVPNLVFAGIAGGNVNLYAQGADVHLVVDLVGYFTTDASTGTGRFVPMDPIRKLDTRNPPFRAIRAGGQQDFGMAGQLSLYPFEISGVIANTTAASPTELTFITVYPKQESGRPLASNLNVTAGEDRPNLVAVGTSTFGFISIYNEQGDVHVILDVAGWFTA